MRRAHSARAFINGSVWLALSAVALAFQIEGSVDSSTVVPAICCAQVWFAADWIVTQVGRRSR